VSPFASYPLNSRLVRAVLGFFAIALVCLVFADVAITTLTPWDEFARLARGVVTPDFFATEDLWLALLNTIAFALLGVTLAIALGFLLAVAFGWRAVRVFCAVVRGVHELSATEKREYDSLVRQVNDYAEAKLLLNAKESVRVYELQKSIEQLAELLPPDTSGQPTAAQAASIYARLA